MGTAVFLSYARNDDLKPPFDDAMHGWVTFFWHQLRFELTNSGLSAAPEGLQRRLQEDCLPATEGNNRADPSSSARQELLHLRR